MKNLSSPDNCHPEPSGSALPTASQLLAQLTEAQHQRLFEFASKRLTRLATTPTRQRLLGRLAPQDLVNSAAEKVLLGEAAFGARGRRLSWRNRQSPEAFLRCLEGIINSQLSACLSSSEARYDHLPVYSEPDLQEHIALSSDPAAPIQRRNIKELLFERLRQCAAASPHLLPIIAQWELNFLGDDRIADATFDPNHVYRVRLLARRILNELASEVDSPANGRQMLLL